MKHGETVKFDACRLCALQSRGIGSWSILSPQWFNIWTGEYTNLRTGPPGLEGLW